MTGFAQNVLLGTTRVQTTFVDHIGNTRRAGGTGFWLMRGLITQLDFVAFVTNRHNVDPRMKLGAQWRTARVEIQLRKGGGFAEMVDLREGTAWCEVANLDQALFADDGTAAADCAILFNPEWVDRPDGFVASLVLSEHALATAAELESAFAVGDAASFIGFPGSDGVHWWDQRYELPISRPAWLASWPAITFTHAEIATADVMLVSGLSFTGSSGSPVIAHQKPGVAARIVGIMSGHYPDATGAGSLLGHSGLSYLTRSTAIRALLERGAATGYSSPTVYSGLESAREPDPYGG